MCVFCCCSGRLCAIFNGFHATLRAAHISLFFHFRDNANSPLSFFSLSSVFSHLLSTSIFFCTCLISVSDAILRLFSLSLQRRRSKTLKESYIYSCSIHWFGRWLTCVETVEDQLVLRRSVIYPWFQSVITGHASELHRLSTKRSAIDNSGNGYLLFILKLSLKILIFNKESERERESYSLI